MASVGQALAHRGPDASAEWVDDEQGVAFAHRHLSIIDVSPAGAHPMVFASGRLVLCSNCKVYNASDIHAVIAAQLAADGPATGYDDKKIDERTYIINSVVSEVAIHQQGKDLALVPAAKKCQANGSHILLCKKPLSKCGAPCTTEI